MPGPSNIKKKRKSQGKGQKRKPRPEPLDSQDERPTNYDSSSPSSRSPSQLLTPPPPLHVMTSPKEAIFLGGESGDDHDDNYLKELDLIPQSPFIHDPGNGPRVRDTRAFLTSKFFAQPPALDIPLCAEFAQEEILEMLRTILPEETALILWYNKSRATSRICPACQRLYRLGDVLLDHMSNEHERLEKRPSPTLEREQEISGICSPMCFILASFNYPGAIQSAWGRMEDEMDDKTWELLNGPGAGNVQNDVSLSLGMLVRMTRLHDLGLAQLCFDGGEELIADGDYYDGWEATT